MIRKAIIALLTFGAIGTAGLWALTLWLGGIYHYEHTSQRWWLGIGRGGFVVIRSQTSVPIEGLRHLHPGWNTTYRRPMTLRGLVWLPPSARIGRTAFQMLQAPLWIPFILFAAYPMMVLLRGPVRRWRRRKKGLCIKCGYDLTGNVSGVCPECGATV